MEQAVSQQTYLLLDVFHRSDSMVLLLVCVELHRRRSLMACARRMFSRSSLGIITISGAVLWPQSMKPTYEATREQPTQVVVLGRASSRIAGISQPHFAQLRMGISRERLLDGTAFDLGCTVVVHPSLLGDATTVAERLAHLLTGRTHGSTFTLCFNV